MGKNSVHSKFKELPPNAQKQVRDFVDYLYNRYVKSGSKQIPDKPLSESPFVGMWNDREDMIDSTEWVRQQRKA